jgi:hypothetical protein
MHLEARYRASVAATKSKAKASTDAVHSGHVQRTSTEGEQLTNKNDEQVEEEYEEAALQALHDTKFQVLPYHV